MNSDLDTIAQILSSIAAPSDRRQQRRIGDLEGPYDIWFDGGAVKINTGWTEYDFADGSAAVVSYYEGGWSEVQIRLPGGSYVRVVQQVDPPYHFQ